MNTDSPSLTILTAQFPISLEIEKNLQTMLAVLERVAEDEVVVFPRLMKGANRWSRIEVMNISDEPIDVTIKFFNQFGSTLYTDPSFTLQPKEAAVKNTNDSQLGLPYFEGSGVVYIQSTSTNSSRAVLVGVGDLMYSSGDPDGNRAALYEGIGQ